ncbi:MAG TPA: SAM-dependent methyltransferase [Terriglobales bacterium]|nr:SAM-dependent methyltransferase [Terriglobales bacterium]
MNTIGKPRPMTPAPADSPLRRLIAEEIARRGPVPFSRYMELCLYHPELGYYSRAEEKFGKGGDFYTSSDVCAVFGRLLARQFDQMWRALGEPPSLDVIELGPGRGLFAQDVLANAERKYPRFYAAARYRLVESSPSLRARLQTTFGPHIAQERASVHAGMSELAPAGNAIVFANEFFDALPVEVLDYRGEVRVGMRDQHFIEQFAPPSAEVLEFVDRYGVHPENGERVEAAPAYREWLRQIAGAFHRGFVLAVDYGYTRGELLAGRHRGTIAAFRRHTLSRDPYEAPGEQDITAHVNFTALGQLARAAGIGPVAMVTQSQLLMGIGEADQFAEIFEDSTRPQEHAKRALQLKHLVTPAGMGESFHALLLAKGVGKEKAAQLSGLRFASSRGEFASSRGGT